MRKDRVTGKRVGIFGMARSGLACAKLLKKLGAQVFVTDAKPDNLLTSEIAQLVEQDIDFETGGHTLKAITNKDYLIISPGVPLDIPILKEAQNLGIPIFSEIEVAFWLTDAKIVGLTGSNGKTTTTALVGDILKEDRKECEVGGNIGIPFSNLVEKVSSDGIIVLELSSFQLERIEEFKPYVAVVLNLTPDHLDRYPDLRSYMEAKLRIFENQTDVDFAVLNADDKNSMELALYSASKKMFFSTQKELELGAFVKNGMLVYKMNGKEEKIIETKDIEIKGPHNLSNATAACAICAILGVSPVSMRETLKRFKGVEHRLEEVATLSGVRFVNDSKATNVESVWYALQSVEKPIILIAGGKDKGGDFTRLRELVQNRVKALILIGEAKEKIHDALSDLVSTFHSDSLEEAVELSFKKAEAGDTVLLSPACASFDMFKDYEHRGEVFKSSVKRLTERTNGKINS
ncbi:MAG: UDP-N-acetylmuramoyl-L-alanine--D-glutamate ligase [candidate division Zixibacteria bacterium]|nr:UDP-N-acetylmuramoyl-L-alanine--D-glutamate ligase [candidate division Zixibacteria bacterium]